MAKIDTFYSAFDGVSLGAEWQLTSTNPTSATESGGNLVIESLSGSVLSGVETVNTFDWTNSSLIVEVPSGARSDSTYIQAVAASGFSPAIRVNSGPRPSAGFLTTSYGNYALGTSGHRFVRLTHDGTNFTWEGSTDGISWTLFHTQSVGTFGAVTSSRLRITTQNASVTSFTVAAIGTAPATARFRPYFITG